MGVQFSRGVFGKESYLISSFHLGFTLVAAYLKCHINVFHIS